MSDGYQNNSSERQKLIAKAEKILSRQPPDGEQLQRLFKPLEPPALAEIINNIFNRRAVALLAVEPDKRLEVIDLVSSHAERNIINELNDEQLAGLVESASGSQRLKLLRNLEHNRVEQIATRVSDKLADQLRQLANYPHKTVGRIMLSEVPTVKENETSGQAQSYLRRNPAFGGSTHQLYVIDRHGRFEGIVPLERLIGEDAKLPIRELMVPSNRAAYLTVYTSQKQAAKVFQQFDLVEAAVVDSNNVLVGRVLVEDILDVLHQEFSEQLQKLGGIGGAIETLETPPIQSSRRRLPWMVLNIFLDLIAVTAIMPFEETIAQVTALAVLMPIISDMGGNVGIQALTVSIRSVNYGSFRWELLFREIRKELVVGVTNGLILGLVIGVVGLVGWGNPYLGFVVAAAMLFQTVLSSTVGGAMPLILKKMRLDPALMSGAILTTITDFLGFLVFLGLATALLPLLK